MLICLCPCFCSFPCCRELYKFTSCVKQKPQIWLHLKHLEFCNFFNEKGKHFSDLHFAVKWRIICPQDRIIVTLEKGKCLLSMVLILKKSGEYYLNFVKFRVLILKTTFYCLHKVKFETGGISPPVQSLDALNNMSGEENYSILSPSLILRFLNWFFLMKCYCDWLLIMIIT